MNNWKMYARRGQIEARPFVVGEDLTHISISSADMGARYHKEEGSMVARNPVSRKDLWFINRDYFKAHYEANDK